MISPNAVACSPVKNVCAVAVVGNLQYVFLKSIMSIVLFKLTVFLIFCMDGLTIIEIGVLKLPAINIIVFLYNFPSVMLTFSLYL